MNVGTKSVIIGVHWPLHGFTVALAWYKLYGFRRQSDFYVGNVSLWQWRLWLCFFVHDLGYYGKPNMDGEEGERHPELGAKILSKCNRWKRNPSSWVRVCEKRWDLFCLYHSRFYARRHGHPYSLLCVADKLSITFEPWWLYIPRTMLTGELREYMHDRGKYEGEPGGPVPTTTRRAWLKAVKKYMRNWAWEHRDGRADTWTPDREEERERFPGKHKKELASEQ